MKTEDGLLKTADALLKTKDSLLKTEDDTEQDVNICLWCTQEQEQQEQWQKSDEYSTAVLKIDQSSIRICAYTCHIDTCLYKKIEVSVTSSVDAIDSDLK